MQFDALTYYNAHQMCAHLMGQQTILCRCDACLFVSVLPNMRFTAFQNTRKCNMAKFSKDAEFDFYHSDIDTEMYQQRAKVPNDVNADLVKTAAARFARTSKKPLRSGAYRETRFNPRIDANLASEKSDKLKAGEFFDDILEEELENTVICAQQEKKWQWERNFDNMEIEFSLLDNLHARYRRDPESDSTQATPTAVQCVVIPRLLEDLKFDMAIRAPTGSGKTIAYLLPIIQKIYERKALHKDEDVSPMANAPYAIIVAPTQDLAIQLFKDANDLIEGLNIRVSHAIGGRMMEQTTQNSDLLIGTIGRIENLIRSDDHSEKLKPRNLLFFVMDEYDHYTQRHDFEDFELMMRQTFLPAGCRVVLLSASFCFDVQTPLLELAEWVTVKDDLPSHNIIQEFICVLQLEKNFVYKVNGCVGVAAPSKATFLLSFLNQTSKGATVTEGAHTYHVVPRTIVFTATRRRTDSVAVRLISSGYRAFAMHAGYTSTHRANALKNFKSGKFDILVATNIAARGINVPNVSYVINFDLPRNRSDAYEYLHRVGRTARMGHVGAAISLFDPDTDQNFAPRAVKMLEQLGRKVPECLTNLNDQRIEQLIQLTSKTAAAYDERGDSIDLIQPVNILGDLQLLLN